MKPDKASRQLARQLYTLSLAADGRVSPERVTGILACLEKNPPPRRHLPTLKAFRALVATALARGEARIEHAGPVSAATIQTIAAAMTARYGRPIAPSAKPNPALLAGIRVRVGDDLYDTSVSARLAGLAAREG
ncbi:MAG: F0F1 ATP synthase subunit delta [Opitutaceae bacterium]|jgi:F-type H+-transporting ATPase subunit delta|nr:F0F1 ATP synthase subunit delta [Opitutaceae bacterium]